jgi:membrane-associated protein
MPIIRTFAPVVAGAGTMSYPRFATYNVAGGILWVVSMTLTGYFLGQAIHNLEEHIHVVVAIVIFLSLVPGIIAYLRARLQSRRRGGPPPAALM